MQTYLDEIFFVFSLIFEIKPIQTKFRLALSIASISRVLLALSIAECYCV